MRVAVVEWFPRVCGATDWALHLSHAVPPRGVTLDRVTFSASGRPLAAWDRAELWRVHPIRDAVAVLNAYDLVVLSDVVCFAPALVQRGRGVPYYVGVLNELRTAWVSMYHGGTYPAKYDETLRAVLASPSFSGTLITTRLPEGRARLDRLAARPIRWVNHPYLPYSLRFRPPPCATPLRRRKRRALLLTARIAVNKGQNVALYLGPRAGVDVELFGYNAFGLPSIAWRLWELATALGYDVVEGPPRLRRDVAHLTHPRANRFYTGTFAVRSGRHTVRYRDGYLDLAEIDWRSAALHLSLPSVDFRGTLEYVTLDAVAAGAVAIVPEHSVAYPRYPAGTFPTVPFTRASIWAREDGTPRVKLDPVEGAAIVTTIRDLAHRTPLAGLERIAALQRAALETQHDPDVVLRKILRSVR